MRNDNNDFRESGKLYVRYFSAAERRNLLEAVRKLGISAGDMNKGKFKYDPNATNTFEIDIREKTIDYVAQPSVCAAMCSSGARFFSVTEFLRLAELKFEAMPRFPLWHIPHDGRKFPIKLLCSVSVARDEFEAYHEKMRDTGVRELIPGAYDYRSAVEAFDVSRLLCDVERYIGSDEVMERYGMGFCYEKVYDGTVIKDVSDGLRSRTLKYYNEHHQKVNEKCESHPQTLLFDMHSYSDEIVPADFLEEGRQTPDVCIGTDSKFTPLSLSVIAKYRFEEAGFSTELNYPYSGCYVPESAVSGKADCISVMFEFNKRIYLNEDGEVDGEKRAAIRAVLEKIIADCVYLGIRENSSKNPLFYEDGTPAYEGFSGFYRPLGEGKAFYPSGTVYQEGMFDDKGLLFGREYYPNGQLRFEGIYKHKNRYGPNYPVYGSYYSDDGKLEYKGKFQISFGGSQSWPFVTVPENFGRVLQPDHPRLYGLKTGIDWKTVKESFVKRP